MKKSISILLSLIMVLSVFTIVPLSASADETMYFDYRVIGDNTAEITGYTGISSFIDIPSEINGLTVTSIGDWAFNGYGRMTDVTIPDTVTNIGEGAFWECKGLKEVFIPASVTSISDSAFYDCTGITRFKVDGNNPAYRSLNGDLYDKSAATLIQYASGKTATSFTIPDSVINIKEGTFIFSCLTEITVPKSVRNIDDYAIGYYYNNNHMPAPIDGFVIRGFVGTAAKLYATDNDITFVALESDYVSEYEYTVLDDGTAEITKYYGNGGNIVIPPTLGGYIVTALGTSVLGGSVFRDCSDLTGVTIPDSVTSIGYATFSGCSKLTKVIIPDSVASIGDNAFSSCSLTSVTIPDSVTSIGFGAFAGCSSLTEVTIPDSVTSIGGSVFNGCSNLTEVNIPNSVTSMGGGVFSGCSSLTKVTIGDSVTSIGNEAFYGCSNLTEVTIPKSVMTIGKKAFYFCDRLIEVNIPDSVTSIGEEAFRNCSSLTEATIGNSVKNISWGAFIGCSNMTRVTIGNSVKSISEYAFDGCENLTEVTIPDSVTTIGEYAFGYYYDDDWNDLKVDGFTIYGNHGTAAEKYANDNGFTFIVPEVKPEILLGDVDNDNVVGIIDTTYIQRYNAGFRIPVSEEDILARGDVDGDGEVGVIDSTYIQRYDAGFNTPYPIGEAMN